MDDSVELRMSVTSIKRVDPYAKDILATSTHVALYKFNASHSEWEKTETEGALFLYSRNGEPYHSVMIMNRLNMENLIEPIVKEFDYQMQAPFLLYRNSRNRIFGIWFYNHDECANLTVLLDNVMDRVREKCTDKLRPSDDVDIFRLLSRAQEDFNKTPAKSELPHFSTPQAPDVTSQSVMEFFAKASGKTVAPAASTPEVEMHYTLQRLMSNPAHSVEHIEKQQRSTTPQERTQMRNKVGSNPQADRRSAPISLPSGENRENGYSSFIHVLASSPPSALAVQQAQEERKTSSPLAQLLETPQKPALMPPMMFASSASKQEKAEQELIDANGSVEPLTKNQMLQAFAYLLKTDPEFVTKLHEAYVKSLTEIVNHNALI